jgi:hypothetical protein
MKREMGRISKSGWYNSLPYMVTKCDKSTQRYNVVKICKKTKIIDFDLLKLKTFFQYFFQQATNKDVN